MDSFSAQFAKSLKVKMSQDCSPFDLLPNEMVLKIVNMFFNSENGMDWFNDCICKEFTPIAQGAAGVKMLAHIAPERLKGHVIVTIKTGTCVVLHGPQSCLILDQPF